MKSRVTIWYYRMRTGLLRRPQSIARLVESVIGIETANLIKRPARVLFTTDLRLLPARQRKDLSLEVAFRLPLEVVFRRLLLVAFGSRF